MAPYVLDGADFGQFREPSALGARRRPASTNVALYFGAQIDADGLTPRRHRAQPRRRRRVVLRQRASARAMPLVVLDASASVGRGQVQRRRASLRAGGTHSTSTTRRRAASAWRRRPTGSRSSKQVAPVLVPTRACAGRRRRPRSRASRSFRTGRGTCSTRRRTPSAKRRAATASCGRARTGTLRRPRSNRCSRRSPPASAAAIRRGDRAVRYGAGRRPVPVPRLDGAGKIQVRVLYTGYAAPPGPSGRASAIGFAARYGETRGRCRGTARPCTPSSKHPERRPRSSSGARGRCST